MSTAWTDELKAEVVQAYQDRNPTPENSMDIVKELAEEYEKTANGIRMILTSADVYVKKAAAAPAAKKEGAAPRVNKAECIAALSAAITEAGGEIDDEILSKLTGKAAVYFTAVLAASK
jgi:hypothetical protein